MSDYRHYTKVTFIQVIAEKSFVVSCRPCNGSGHEPKRVHKSGRILRLSDDKCKTCNARGMLRIESDDIPTNCGVCNGSGRISGGSYTDGSHTEFDFRRCVTSAKGWAFYL
jgi:DnaJ-class molecular chaperone